MAQGNKPTKVTGQENAATASAVAACTVARQSGISALASIMSYGGYSGGYGGGSFGGAGSYGGGGGGSFGGGGGQFGGGQGRDLDSIQLRKEDFRGLPAFEKNFYHEHPAVTARTDAEIAAYRDTREIHIEGHDVPKPVTTFEEASFPGRWRKRCKVYYCHLQSLPHSLVAVQSMSWQRSTKLVSQNRHRFNVKAGLWLC